jgi:sugar lactone lactonase YvrE
MYRSKALAKVLLVFTALGCDQAVRPRGAVPDQGPTLPPPDAGSPAVVYDARVALSDDGPAPAPLPDAAVAPPSDAPVAPPSDTLPPVSGDFPLASAMAAKPELWAMSGGHVEGPSYRDGEIFMAVVGKGLVRVGTDRKVYSYLPGLSPLGTYLLGDGSILVCDDKHTMVQVFRDGKVGIVGTSGACNDITVDADGNIYFSDFKSSVYRITPAGEQTKVLTLNAPNGIEVDPAGKYLYILPRPSDIYRVMINKDGPMGTPEKVGVVPGSVTDGCVFDAWGNLWAAAYYTGKVAVFDTVNLKVLALIDTGGGGLTNMTWGGPRYDELFTTNDNKGVFHIPVGVRGFHGHPGAPQYTLKGYLDIVPAP